MAEQLKRKKDGTIEGIFTMGDYIVKEPLTPEQEEAKRRKAELEKKYVSPV